VPMCTKQLITTDEAVIILPGTLLYSPSSTSEQY
jgi:hypothetical protein